MRRFRISPAVAIACVALFFSLAGTGMAAPATAPRQYRLPAYTLFGPWQPPAVQNVTIVNQGAVWAPRLQRIERALEEVANGPLRQAWHTPILRFTPQGGWPVTISEGSGSGHSADSTGSSSGTSIDYTTEAPSAQIGWVPGDHFDDETSLSHEVFEMLIDPFGERVWNGYLVEVADPVSWRGRQVDGIWISDFAYPAWYALDRSGPLDWQQRLHGRRFVPLGFAARVSVNQGSMLETDIGPNAAGGG